MLVEESAHKHRKPVSYGFVGVFVCCKGVAGKEVDSFSGKAVAQHIVKEEVVKFIGAYEVFCLLSDVAVAVGWNKFGADGCVYDVGLRIFPGLQMQNS